jgi:GNAT superfamily N-acetyltransferase
MIRQFEPADANACCEVVHACLALDSQLSQALYSTLRTIASPQAMRRRSTLFYIAVYESSNGVVGVAGLDMNEVRLLYVSPEHQSQGIGGALLDHLAAMVPSSMFADIFVYSTPAAAGFYSRRGFKAMGEYTFDLNGEQLQTIFMIKLLRHSPQESGKPG